ncbi:hypothetical protein ACFSTH_06905 [Paenibacillus yanchengensis]
MEIVTGWITRRLELAVVLADNLLQIADVGIRLTSFSGEQKQKKVGWK